MPIRRGNTTQVTSKRTRGAWNQPKVVSHLRYSCFRVRLRFVRGEEGGKEGKGDAKRLLRADAVLYDEHLLERTLDMSLACEPYASENIR